MTRSASGEDPDLPTGTVRFLFSDIEGSTRLWEAAPPLMAGAVATQDRIIRDNVSSAGGQVLKHTGDRFAVLEGPAAAVTAAADITKKPHPSDFGLDAQQPARRAELVRREGARRRRTM